jgi:GWxTD domain-containing protein
MDKRGRKIAGETQEKTITVASESKTKSSGDFRTSQINLNVEQSKYEIRFTLKDKIANKSFSKEFEVDGKKYSVDQPVLSDILFAQAAGPADTNSTQFNKGNIMVVPSVNRMYGGDDDGRMLYYIEVYPGGEDSQKITVQSLIRKRKGNMVYRDTLTSNFEGAAVRQLREVSIEAFEPGEYELEIELQGRRGKKLDQSKGTFQVRWTEESLLEHNWNLIVRQISLIAESKEVNTLEDAKTLEERRQALKDYWAGKDPFPETPNNELKIEFYRRIRFVNDNFGYLNRPGWETDRGRVLVRYGPPDQVDDYPFSLSSYPYQEWHYYKGGRYRKFTFVDDNHDGDYRLVYPFDGLWQTPDF